MAYDGWIEFGGVEVVNLARTVQLSEALGIDTVWTRLESVQWIEGALGGTDYDVPSNAPWYDPLFPASGEFAGVIPLSLVGLDDSTLESTPTEYVGDGGNAGISRNKTLPVVANVALVASTERGAEYGLRWLNRVLRREGHGYKRMHCSGADLRYFRFSAAGQDAVQAYRRNVRLSRGTSVTRKRSNHCSATWLVTFTWTAADPFEYSDPIPALSGLGDPSSVFMEGGFRNLAYNARGLSTGSMYEYINRWSWTRTFLTGLTVPDLPGVTTAVRITSPSSSTSGAGRGMDIYANPNEAVPPTTGSAVAQRVEPGQQVSIVAYFRASVAGNWQLGTRFHDGQGNWLDPLTFGPAVVSSPGQWHRVETTAIVPGGAPEVYLCATLRDAGTVTYPASSTLDMTALMVTTDAPGPGAMNPMPSGSLVMVEEGCPVFDYSPIYDPQFPALVEPPAVPDFYPEGWAIEAGMTFDRFWTVLPPTAPGQLNVVPVLTLTSASDARMVRVSVWDWDGDVDRQCDPVWTAIITYLPAGDMFVIDGVQRACYVWDGFSPEVRRTDSLVFGSDASPVEWASFSTAGSLLVTLDIFSESDLPDGDGTVRAELAWVQKSD